MPKIFISYRRGDSGPYAGRLYDRLAAHFGDDQVFMDIDNIELGEDFSEVVTRKVGACDVLLAVIGRSWTSAVDAEGKVRLAQESDWVRMEITHALDSGIRLIPVLVGGADMPEARDLPPRLAALTRRNALVLSDLRFRQDADALIRAIEKGGDRRAPAPAFKEDRSAIGHVQDAGSVPRPPQPAVRAVRSRRRPGGGMPADVVPMSAVLLILGGGLVGAVLPQFMPRLSDSLGLVRSAWTNSLLFGMLPVVTIEWLLLRRRLASFRAWIIVVPLAWVIAATPGFLYGSFFIGYLSGPLAGAVAGTLLVSSSRHRAGSS
jgi:hypothetical protein